MERLYIRQKLMLALLTFLFCLNYVQKSFATETYSLWLGESITVDAPTFSAGTIDQVNITSISAQGYLDISKKGDFSIVIRPIKYYSKTITVKFLWTGSYLGSYSGKTEKIDYEKTVKVTIKRPQVKEENPNITIQIGQTEQLKYNVIPDYGIQIPITWGTVDAIAPSSVYMDVSGDGYVTGKSAGTGYAIGLPWGEQSLAMVYTVKVEDNRPRVTADPKAGTYAPGTKVTLTADKEGAEIYYTKDGSAASRNGIKYTEPIVLSEDVRIRARAYLGDIEGPAMSKSYKVNHNKLLVSASPAGGTVMNGTVVKLTTLVPDAQIYYTTDGKNPTTSSTLYTDAGIVINSSLTLKARAYKDGYETSDIMTEQYIVQELITRSVTTSSAGYATFYDSSYAFELPEVLSASVVLDANNNKLTYKKIADGATSNNVVPKGVAVMLASSQKKASSYTLTSTDKSASYTGTNLLRGSDTATMTNGGSNSYYYKLSYGHTGTNLSNIFGWYWGAASGGAFQIDGHKAWLLIPKSAGAKGYVSFTEDEATAIQDIEDTIGDSGIYYDLQGRRVGVPKSKGIYIHNGKKVVINK